MTLVLKARELNVAILNKIQNGDGITLINECCIRFIFACDDIYLVCNVLSFFVEDSYLLS